MDKLLPDLSMGKRELREDRLLCQSHTGCLWAQWDFAITLQDVGLCLVGGRFQLLGCCMYECPEGLSSSHTPAYS